MIYLEITSNPATCHGFKLPSCLSTFNIGSLKATTCITIDDFGVFPSSLIELYLQDGIFPIDPTSTTPSGVPIGPGPAGSAPSGSATGFAVDGTIAWPQVFAAIPNLKKLQFIGGNLRGSVPTEIPSQLNWFEITNNQLTGAFPIAFFSNLDAPITVYVDVSGNDLSGELLATLFTQLDTTVLKSITFNIAHNRLEGALQPVWFSPLKQGVLESFAMDLGHNLFAGTIPNGFLNELTLNLAAPSPSFKLVLASNQLTDIIPTGLFGSLPPLGTLYFNASHNHHTGSLPSPIASFLPDSNLIYDVSHNAMTGSIPPLLILGSRTENVTFGALSLILRGNLFQSTIPDGLFHYNSVFKREVGEKLTIGEKFAAKLADSDALSSSSHPSQHVGREESLSQALVFARANRLLLDLANNTFSGSVPMALFNGVFTEGSAFLDLDLSNNLFTSLPTDITTLHFGAKINASRNRLNALPSACGNSGLSLDLSNNQLTSNQFPASWNNCKFIDLRLSENLALSGTIPYGLLNSSYLTVFHAFNTSLVGDLPPYHPNLAEIDVSSTSMVFCSEASRTHFGDYNGTCKLASAACTCKLAYTGSCTTACNSTSPPCLGPPPSREFYCSSTGVWTAPSTTNPTLTIPVGVGEVIVLGNVSSSSIVFTGIGSTVTIGGCASNLTSIVIELTQEEIRQIGHGLNKSLITFSGNCGTDFNNIAISIKKGEGCRKISSKKFVSSDSQTIGAIFTVDSSGCNTWWIILVSVICGVLLLTVITIVLMAVFWPAFRAKIRPFSVKRPQDSAL